MAWDVVKSYFVVEAIFFLPIFGYTSKSSPGNCHYRWMMSWLALLVGVFNLFNLGFSLVENESLRDEIVEPRVRRYWRLFSMICLISPLIAMLILLTRHMVMPCQ